MLELAAIPLKWKTAGVWYAPDVALQCIICGGTGSLAIGPCTKCKGQGQTRNRDLAPDERFWVRLQPFSGDEYQQSLAELRSRAMVIQNSDGKSEVLGDPIAIANEQAQSTCRARVLECHNGIARELDDDGEPSGPVITLKDGHELVDFILQRADQRARKVLDDVYRAISDISHLKAGLKKNWTPPSASSAPDTNPRDGSAANVADPATSITTKSQNASSVSIETAMGRDQMKDVV